MLRSLNYLGAAATVALGLAAGVANAATIDLGSFDELAASGSAAPAGSFDPINLVAVTGGGIGGPIGFTSPIAGTLTVLVQDCCLVGDVYQTFVNGTSLGYTTFVALGGPTASSGTFTTSIGAGANSFDIDDIILNYVGADSPFGGGTVTSTYDPAGLTVSLSVTGVPEPATWAMMLVGFGGLGAAIRTRRSRAVATA
jgi:hypothetical protein